MTFQVAPAVGGLVMILAVLLGIGLGAGAIVQLARRRRRSALALVTALACVIALYSAALVGAGVASRPVQLKPGDTKCFDDWCATLLASRRSAATGRLLVDVRLENRGRGRPMRSNLAHAYLEVDGRGRVSPEDRHQLQAPLEAGSTTDLVLVFDLAPAVHTVRFLVAEDDTFGPGTFTIGDESSPLHARAGWPLTTS